MSKDPIQAWLNSAGRFPLLPKQEILRLAKKRDTLEPGSAAYTKIINKICEHNLRLVPNVVRTYLGKRMNFNMTSEVASDLLQQGYLGLRRAAEKFDATRGFTFSTYAQRWIYQSVTRWHNTLDRAIYIPENCMTELIYLKKHGKRSNGRNGRLADEYLAAASGALDVTSVDRKVNDDEEATSLVELMGDENRLISTKSLPEGRAEGMLRKLMDDCNIKPRNQEIVISYAKRGRMTIVAAKLQISPKHCQNLYQESVRIMKAEVRRREEAADRLKSN